MPFHLGEFFPEFLLLSLHFVPFLEHGPVLVVQFLCLHPLHFELVEVLLLELEFNVVVAGGGIEGHLAAVCRKERLGGSPFHRKLT